MIDLRQNDCIKIMKNMEDNSVDLVLTDMEKAVILESVNNALKNPLQMTQSQYTQK